ncbi:hypothetical protein AVEN_56712-1 [Araneus ventricosus]|uniref:Uncharacterized protein n=1 Tax=Araneus ventricosus TaxID=182803 RepID=A0A4Y2QTA5_ARAVE|nr:hypothetical protein AVEN_56712-1 [Araneus ventricosus]
MEDGWIPEEKSFRTKNEVILQPTNLDQYYDAVSKKLMSECEEFQEKESEGTLDEIIKLEVRLSKYVPLKGSSHIDLPLSITQKHAVINVKNNYHEC